MSESSSSASTTGKSVESIQEIFSKFGPICNSEGFYQHSGQCWSDTIQMIMLYADGIKEITQPKLALETISEDEIASQFQKLIVELLVTTKVLEKPNALSPFVKKNLRAIYLYFVAVQKRFQRHYLAEYNRFLILGPLECDEYDAIGNKALEQIKEISKTFRSIERVVNKPGIQSAIMGKSAPHYLKANREFIGKTKENTYGTGPGIKYEAGGYQSELEFLVEVYSLYFKMQLKLIDFRTTSFTSIKDAKGIYISSQLVKGTNRHARCFYTCGGTEYYFDDNEGVLQFPWRSFLDEYVKIRATEIVMIQFLGIYTISQKDTGKIIFQYKFLPTLRYQTATKTIFLLFLKNMKPISLEFDASETKKHIEIPEAGFLHRIEINLTDNIFESDALFGIFSETKDYAPSRYNIHTGKVFTARLKANNSQLRKAIQLKNKKQILTLLNKGNENIRTTDTLNTTVLHTAVYLEDIDFVKDLLGRPNIPLDAIDYNGYTPLLYAIRSNQFDIASLLIRAGADSSIPFVNQAIAGFKLPKFAIELAVDKNTKLYLKDEEKYIQSLTLIDLLLEKEHTLSGFQAKMRGLFQRALENNNLELVKLFIKWGYDINQKLTSNEFPLEIVVQNENLPLFEYLVVNGANFKMMEQQGTLIFNLVLTIWRNPDVEKVIDILVKQGFDPNRKLARGINYLWTAKENPNAFLTLVNVYGLDVNSISKESESLLQVLIKQSSFLQVGKKFITIPILEMIEAILQKGANVNYQDRKGNTALMYTAESGEDEKMKLLCKYGANPTLRNKDSRDVYSFIQEYVKVNPEEKQKFKDAIQICKDKQKALKSAQTGAVLGGFTRKRKRFPRRKTRRT